MSAEPGASAGALIEISGAVVRARCHVSITLGEVVYVGRDRLVGEVIALDRDVATIQVYEETAGLSVGAPIVASGGPLAVTLGPGLLGAVFDGVQRPLDRLALLEGDFLGRGQHLEPLNPDRLWEFHPAAHPGSVIHAGHLLGIVYETTALEHRIAVPPMTAGTLSDIVADGAYRVSDVIGHVETSSGDRTELRLA